MFIFPSCGIRYTEQQKGRLQGPLVPYFSTRIEQPVACGRVHVIGIGGPQRWSSHGPSFSSYPSYPSSSSSHRPPPPFPPRPLCPPPPFAIPPPPPPPPSPWPPPPSPRASPPPSASALAPLPLPGAVPPAPMCFSSALLSPGRPPSAAGPQRCSACTLQTWMRSGGGGRRAAR